ncbi:hypothetical protein IV54_GL001214 [Levilactobacillus paucivorans]|uniref:Uncharacterized protein n=1 Tax=Levilactobacillus paucivorans TaxID=616990 RepID=A0A0R2LG04_9LACO|nr:hypothetical protein IV54_GL001214 [Levilactobacillus paucivorans]
MGGEDNATYTSYLKLRELERVLSTPTDDLPDLPFGPTAVPNLETLIANLNDLGFTVTGHHIQRLESRFISDLDKFVANPTDYLATLDLPSRPSDTASIPALNNDNEYLPNQSRYTIYDQSGEPIIESIHPLLLGAVIGCLLLQADPQTIRQLLIWPNRKLFPADSDLDIRVTAYRISADYPITSRADCARMAKSQIPGGGRITQLFSPSAEPYTLYPEFGLTDCLSVIAEFTRKAPVDPTQTDDAKQLAQRLIDLASGQNLGINRMTRQLVDRGAAEDFTITDGRLTDVAIGFWREDSPHIPELSFDLIDQTTGQTVAYDILLRNLIEKLLRHIDLKKGDK